MQIKQQWQNFQVKICGKNKSCTNKCLFYLVERFGLLTRGEANSGLLRSNIPPLHFFFRIAKVLVPTFPIASLGILDWIKFLSGRTSQLTHLSRMRLKRSVAIWNRQKYEKTTMAQPVSGSTSTCVLWLRTRYSRHFPFSIVLSSFLSETSATG